MKQLFTFTASFLVALLAGCYSPNAALPQGESAYTVIPALDANTGQMPYRIGSQDILSVRVFQEPELSFEETQVDSSGLINFPLIGQVQAAGLTPLQLGNEIERRLGARYIRSPQVVVGVVTSVGQRVVVEGSVMEPGVYEVAGSSSLLKSIARAKGPTRTAATNEVVIFRQIDGQRMGAIFDLQAIREGKAPNPTIQGGDTIVVGFSGLKGAYRDILAAAPIFNVFARF